MVTWCKITETSYKIVFFFLFPYRPSGVAVFCKMAEEPKTVSTLKELNFSQLTFQEKVAIKQAGRPLPEIKIVQEGVSHNKKYIRSFNCDWYQRKTWLCGCEVKNALFCFPCLLFGGDSVWSKDGFACIKNLKEKNRETREF